MESNKGCESTQYFYGGLDLEQPILSAKDCVGALYEGIHGRIVATIFECTQLHHAVGRSKIVALHHNTYAAFGLYIITAKIS